MATERVVTGKKYRILSDVQNKVWDVISFWHKAVDCIFNDGKNAETKLGAINGITSDINGTSTSIAASINVVNKLNSSLGGYALTTKNGKIAYYRVSEGADSAVPFSSSIGTDLILNTVRSNSFNVINGKTYLICAAITTHDGNPQPTVSGATVLLGKSVNPQAGGTRGTAILMICKSTSNEITITGNVNTNELYTSIVYAQLD